jgi:hypothetical protein
MSRISVPTKGETREETCRHLYNEELHNFQSSANTMKGTKKKGGLGGKDTKCAWLNEKRLQNLGWKTSREEIITSRRDINIKINTSTIESGCEDVGWI